jgi:hypothetical protein
MVDVGGAREGLCTVQEDKCACYCGHGDGRGLGRFGCSHRRTLARVGSPGRS